MAWIRAHWQSIASQAEGEGWSHSQFLYALCEQEVEQRQQARQHRLLRAAHLPWSKALADYDHGGRIEATSAGPGTGSTFRVTLPVAEVGGTTVAATHVKEVDHSSQQAA